jgi:hypothetical protein
MTPGAFRRDQTRFIHESYYGAQMTIAKIEVERFSLTSLKPFDAVVAAFKSAVGQPNMVDFFKETRATNSFADLERVVQSGLGRTDLMLFAEFDLGDILGRETGSKTPRIMRFVVVRRRITLPRDRALAMTHDRADDRHGAAGESLARRRRTLYGPYLLTPVFVKARIWEPASGWIPVHQERT